MFYPINAKPEQLIRWAVKAGATVVAGQLVKEDTGATAVAAAHTGATILGVALEGGVGDDDDIITIYPVGGSAFDVDFLATGTKKTFDDDDLGTAFDISVTDGVQSVDPDDTTGGFCWVIGYNNTMRTVRVKLENADSLLA